MLDLVFIGFGCLILFAGIWVWWNRGPKLFFTPKQSAYYQALINKMVPSDPQHEVLEMHKIFISALKDLADTKQAKAADVTKVFEDRFPNKTRIWHYHRLRNRIAHEIGTKVTEAEAQTARREYIRTLKALTKK